MTDRLTSDDASASPANQVLPDGGESDRDEALAAAADATGGTPEDGTTQDGTADAPTTDGGSAATTDEPGGDGHDNRERLVRYVQWSLFGILMLVLFVATFRFYFAVSGIIDTFVARRFRPIFNAGFNLAIILATGLGLSVLVRKLA